jgi:hypothetical protein
VRPTQPAIAREQSGRSWVQAPDASPIKSNEITYLRAFGRDDRAPSICYKSVFAKRQTIRIETLVVVQQKFDDHHAARANRVYSR